MHWGETIELQGTKAVGTSVKICTGCQQVKPYDDFHLKGLDKSGSSRFQSICKDCANSKRVARYQKKKDLKKRLARASKQFDLSSCEIEIVYHESNDASLNMTDVMTDYIEAVYAIPVQSSIISRED